MREKNVFPITQRGFSLVEILVAVALLAIIITAFTPLLTASVKGIMDSGEKSKTIYDAQRELEGVVSRNRRKFRRPNTV